MFIQTEPTPNPEVLKFIPGQPVSPGGALEYRDADTAQASPLASQIFEVEGVVRVFMGSDFLTVTKDGDFEWKHLKPPVLAAIMDHYTSGAPILTEAGVGEGHGEGVYEGDA